MGLGLWCPGAVACSGQHLDRDDQLLPCKLEGVEEGARQETEQVRLVVVDSEEAADQLPGMDAPPTTRLLTPFPLLALAVPLRESGRSH